jgi:hypothetical protein
MRDKAKSKLCSPTEEALPHVGRVTRRIDLAKSQPVKIQRLKLAEVYSLQAFAHALQISLHC